MAKFNTSDYPEIGKAAEAYDIARAEFQKLNRQLDETPTNSKSYSEILKRRNDAKTKADAALKKYKDITAKSKSEFEALQKRTEANKKRKFLKAKLKSLQNDRQRAEDKGESTVSIDDAITQIQSDLGKIKTEEKPKPEITEDQNRPKGVPAGAKFTSETGQWTLGDKKWDRNGKSLTPTKTPTPGPEKDKQPELPEIPGVFDPARFRMGEEASMQAAAGTLPIGAKSDLKTLLTKTEFWYDMPDYIFETVPELGDLLVKAVNEKWDNDKFLSSAKLTKWWQSNTGTFRERIVNKAKYNELRTAGQDVTRTDYGQYIARQIRNVKAQAKSIAGVTLDDAQAQQIAEKIYDGNLDDDPLAINRLIIPFIGKVTDRYAGKDVTTYGGQALQNYQVLQGIAKANGLSLKDILPQISTTLTGGDLEKAVLQGLAAGDIDVNRIAQNARMVAAQGQPEYVRNLLNQGYDLEQIYSPYKSVMASVLELNPEQINLNDPTLRNAINNNGDMNIYDFKRALRQDTRWQYTENAREEVSNAALQVLKDFGFQG